MIVAEADLAPRAPAGQAGVRVGDRRVLEGERPAVSGVELERLLLLTVHGHAMWRSAVQWAYEVALDHVVWVRPVEVERLLVAWEKRGVIERGVVERPTRMARVYRLRRSA